MYTIHECILGTLKHILCTIKIIRLLEMIIISSCLILLALIELIQSLLYSECLVIKQIPQQMDWKNISKLRMLQLGLI